MYTAVGKSRSKVTNTDHLMLLDTTPRPLEVVCLMVSQSLTQALFTLSV